MTVDEFRQTIISSLRQAEAEVARYQAMLIGCDQAIAAMRTGSTPPARRDLRGEVAAKLTDKPQSIEAIRAAVGNIKRSQVEAILIRMPLVAQKTAAGWVRAGGDLLSEAAE